MSFFSDWFFGTKTKPAPVPAPVPVPAPAPAPPADPVPAPVPPPSGTQVKIEQIVALRWKEAPVPFNGMMEVSSRKMAKPYRFSYLRITVLQGNLTMHAPVLFGPNNPTAKGYVEGQVFKAGQSFQVNFYIGPVDISKPGLHETSGIGVDTSELGVITTQSAQVVYVK